MTEVQLAEIVHIDPAQAAARQRITQIQDNIQDHHVLVLEALQARDWETLNYSSPVAWYRDIASPEQVSPQIRASIVLALRDEGYSLRSIGSELHVSKNTVARDLVSHDGTADRITGADGKDYPAQRRAPELAERPKDRTERLEREAWFQRQAALDTPGFVIGTPVVAQRAEDTPHCPTCSCYGAEL
jgi:predicted transcriptional regulator